MKYSIILVFTTLILCGCQQHKSKLLKTWITINQYDNNEPKSNSNNFGFEPKVLKFSKDSLTYYNFKFDIAPYYQALKSEAYLIENQVIYLPSDTLDIQSYSQDSMILSSRRNNQIKTVVQSLIEFNQGHRKSEFYEMLTNNTFSLPNDSTKMLFKPSGVYLTDNILSETGYNSHWRIQHFDGELFLVFNEFNITVLHISSFDSDHIRGKAYGQSKVDFEINKTEPNPRFEKSDILGDWISTTNSILPPPVENKSDYMSYELLKIADDKIIRKEGFLTDTLSWEFGVGDHILISGKDRLTWNNRQWQILSVKNDSLTIRRYRTNKSLTGGGVEKLSYIKI